MSRQLSPSILERLGTVSDARLAREAGVNKDTIRRKRIARGIPSVKRPLSMLLQRALAYLRKQDAPVRARDVQRSLRVTLTHTRRILARLWRDGLVVDVADARDGQACLWVAA